MPPVSFLMWVVHVFALCLPVSPGPCSFHGSSQWADSRLTYKVTNKLIKMSNLFSGHLKISRENPGSSEVGTLLSGLRICCVQVSRRGQIGS